MRRTMRGELNRRAFLGMSAAAGAALVAGASLSGCSDADPASDSIVRYSVHPAIGVARVGNSRTESYLAPEVPGETPMPADGFKDATGAIKRQAVRFRVYGYNAAGVPVREIVADEAEIVWSVHVANRKAAWYEFHTALDIPGALPTPRRNADREGAARDELRVDPGAREISGRDLAGVTFTGGRFLGQDVYLGELATDDQGRLIFLGGYGTTYNPTGINVTTFANNDGWCDDISDGPVRATLHIDGRWIEADPGWVVVAPPNYGPSIRAGFVTMYDVVEPVMIDLGWLEDPSVSFAAHILPLFLRLADMQWVNQGALQRFGFGAPDDLTDPALLLRLANPSSANAAFRNEWFERFRNPAYAEMQPDSLPPMYGDDVAIPATNPRQWLVPTKLQFERLRRWAVGDFVDDFDPGAFVPTQLADLPWSQQPAALDRAALESVLGGPFHPGTEITWILRTPSLYSGLFRLKVAPQGQPPRQNFGSVLTPEVALGPRGPLSESGPGDITRWMATPWQTDTASCLSGYEPEIDPYLPTFWPARVPNHVLTEAAYEVLMDPDTPPEERRAAFAQRVDWLRFILRPNHVESLELMIENWPKLGFVTREPGPDDAVAPAVVKVEAETGFGS